MASTRKRGKTHSVRWYGPNGEQIEKGGFPSQKAAADFGQAMEVDIKRGTYIDPIAGSMSLFEFIDSIWRTTLNVKEGTKGDYEIRLNTHIIPELGHLPLSGIKPSTIKSWSVNLKTKSTARGDALSATYVYGIESLLAQILKAAAVDGLIAASPFDKIKRTKPRRSATFIPLEYEEVEALAVSFSPQFRPMIWIGYYAGLRPSEILGLTLDRIDFETGTIKVDRQISRSRSEVFATLKTKKSYRTIQMSAELALILQEHIEAFGVGPHGLTIRNRYGMPMRYKNARDMFSKHARVLGIPVGQGLHLLRHTCASNLIREGVHAKVIQLFLGHETFQITMDIYGHLFPSESASIKEHLDAAATRVKAARRSANLSMAL